MAKSTQFASQTWKGLTRQVIDALPAHFTLADLLKFKPLLTSSYPNNKHVEAKLRQTLQVLRDQGVIEFEGRGRYAKGDRGSTFSPRIDFQHAAPFSSRAQIARVVLETWAELNLFCLNCSSDGLARLPANTPVADFRCPQCSSLYQLKGKDGRFGPVIVGAAYDPTLRAVRNGSNPDYLLMEFDSRFQTVVFGIAIRGGSITEDRIVPRAPLRETARRAGWIGCNIRISGLQKALIIEPMIVDPETSRLRWKTLN